MIEEKRRREEEDKRMREEEKKKKKSRFGTCMELFGNHMCMDYVWKSIFV